MGNGTGPIVLPEAQYNTIKTGVCITGGTYDGTIKVGATYYWLFRGVGHWSLNKGEPGPSQVDMTDAVWNKCKEGGTMTYDPTPGGWRDEIQRLYEWDGQPGEDIRLVLIPGG